MTSLPSDKTKPQTTPEIAASQQFVLWALNMLEIPVESADQRFYTIHLDEPRRAAFDGAASLRLVFEPAASPENASWSALPGSQVYCWLLDQLRAQGAAVHTSPRRQPSGIHEISLALFEAYQIENGSVHLRGCTLDDRPILRLTYRRRSNGDSSPPRLKHVYTKVNGAPLEQELLQALYLDELGPADPRHPKLYDSEIQTWSEIGKRQAVEQFAPAGGDVKSLELDCAAVVWCKYAEGKLAFVIGEHSVETTFSGWAQFFADRRIKPPPYACPLSGKQSYHLTAVDDGRITVADAIDVCQESGQRVVETDLVVCDASGKRVLPEYLEECPVSGSRVAKAEFVRCSVCRQQASPQAIADGRCKACRDMPLIAREDDRLAPILAKHPGLATWRKYALSETNQAYVLRATSLLKQLLVVLDKDELKPLHIAETGRLSRTWREIGASQWSDLLRGTEDAPPS